MNYKMTVEQYEDYLGDLDSMCEKILRIHGSESPQAIAMARIYTSVFSEYQQRLESQITLPPETWQ